MTDIGSWFQRWGEAWSVNWFIFTRNKIKLISCT